MVIILILHVVLCTLLGSSSSKSRNSCSLFKDTLAFLKGKDNGKILAEYSHATLHLTIIRLERFSFECRKVIGFAFTSLRDGLKRFAPLFHPIRSKTKTNCVIASRALRHLHVITSSFDWFTVLSVFFVIG